jgi:hypothetical protein
MWCEVQVCFGADGERLPRSKWSEPVLGRLSVHHALKGVAATLERQDMDRWYQVLYPLGGVCGVTYEAGLLVSAMQSGRTQRPESFGTTDRLGTACRSPADRRLSLTLSRMGAQSWPLCF